MDTDDEIGFHVTVGASLDVLRNFELFADYRYTFLDTDFKSTFTVDSVDGERLATIRRNIDGYDFGLVRAGVRFYL